MGREFVGDELISRIDNRLAHDLPGSRESISARVKARIFGIFCFGNLRLYFRGRCEKKGENATPHGARKRVPTKSGKLQGADSDPPID